MSALPQPFPMPELVPLTRLHVNDSLRVNAERWSLAHDYHRQRQNLHYQALWQPGIVQGLGVKLIPPPEAAHRQFKDAFWVEVQPGLAIDGRGNPIVVEPEPAANRAYPLIIPTPLQTDRTLYIVVRYVDPGGLEVAPSSDRTLERFRFDQRVDVLEAEDIELCRIQLCRGEVTLTAPDNPFLPQANQLDLRFRPQAQLRSHHWLTIQPITSLPLHQVEGFKVLTEAMPGLYPQMQARFDETPVQFSSAETAVLPQIVYGSAQSLVGADGSYQTHKLDRLRNFIHHHGSLLVETPVLDAELRRSLESVKRDLNLQPVPLHHSLRREPFLFNTWPRLGDRNLALYWDQGLVVIEGSLVDGWRGDRLSRTEIREGHELGINLLHYGWQYHRFRQLLS